MQWQRCLLLSQALSLTPAFTIGTVCTAHLCEEPPQRSSQVTGRADSDRATSLSPRAACEPAGIPRPKPARTTQTSSCSASQAAPADGEAAASQLGASAARRAADRPRSLRPLQFSKTTPAAPHSRPRGGPCLQTVRRPFKSPPTPLSAPRRRSGTGSARRSSMAASGAPRPAAPAAAARLLGVLWLVSAAAGEDALKCEDLRVGQYPPGRRGRGPRPLDRARRGGRATQGVRGPRSGSACPPACAVARRIGSGSGARRERGRPPRKGADRGDEQSSSTSRHPSCHPPSPRGMRRPA